MPRTGQKSLTLSEDVYNWVRDYFEKHTKELRARGINSVPALFQTATLAFIGKTEDQPFRLPLRMEMIRGLLELLRFSIFNSSSTMSANYLLSSSIRFMKEEKVRKLQHQNLRNLSDRSIKLVGEFENTLKQNELSQEEESKLRSNVMELVFLMTEHLQVLAEITKDDLSPNPDTEARKMLLEISSFYDRYVSLTIPYLTTVMLLTRNGDRLYHLTEQMNRTNPNSLAAAVEHTPLPY